MEVLLGAGITLVTLLTTSMLSRAGTRADARAKARQEAGEQLAEYVRFVWDKNSADSFLNLQTYLSRLRGPLPSGRCSQPAVHQLPRQCDGHVGWP
jgi:hypothetical protein